MPVFEYTATNPQGEAIRGTLFSQSLAAAAEDLARQGYQVQHVGVASSAGDPVPAEFPPAPNAGTESPRPAETPRDITSQRPYIMTDIVGPLVMKVPLSQLLFFFRQLATMLHAGVGMVQSLDTLSNQTHDLRLKNVVRELREHALAGRPISVGMQRYPEIFSPLMLSMIRVGEEGGSMDRSLQQIADYVEHEIEIRNLVRRVTIYPKLVIAASIIIVLGTNAIIASLGKQGGLDSLLTRPTTWLFLGPLIVGLFLFFRVGLANPRIKHTYDEFLLALPGFGKTVRQLCMAKFGRAFGTLYAGGVAVPRAVELAADACGNEYLRSRMYPAAGRLKEGVGITHAFRETGAFSPIVLDMAHTGETTGNLDFMLNKVAEYYEDEGKTRSVQFGYALGVLALLAVAVYVGYTVITFYAGHFSGLSEAMKE